MSDLFNRKCRRIFSVCISFENRLIICGVKIKNKILCILYIEKQKNYCKILLGDYRFVLKGVQFMATSSIYTSVKVKNKNDCRKLLVALETAESKKAKEVVFSHSVEIVKGDKIKELFK